MNVTTPVSEHRAIVVPDAPKKELRTDMENDFSLFQDVVPQNLFPTTPVHERRALVVPGAPRKEAGTNMGIPFPLFQDEVSISLFDDFDETVLRYEIDELLRQLEEQGKIHIGIATLLIDENGNDRPYTIELGTYLKSLLNPVTWRSNI